jgi:hypothetical protein
MIAVSSQLSALLASGQYARADLYTFALVNGVTLRWSGFGAPVMSGGNTWSAVGVRFLRDKWKLGLGLETDSLKLTLSVDPAAEPAINGVPLRQAARAGLFDGAAAELDWAYFTGQPPALVGTLARFCGTVGVAEADRLGVSLTVDSPLKRLDLQVPWKTYGPQCRWTLGDGDCGVNLTAYGKSGAAAAGATEGVLPTTLADADGTWNLARIQFTSGVNAGLGRSVRLYAQAGGTLTLNAPLPFAPAPGDGFTIAPGCDHALPALTAAITVPGGRHQVAVGPGPSGFVDQGVVYAAGANAGTPLILTGTTPAQGQYEVSGNTYTFAAADAGAQLTVTYVTGNCAASGSCTRVFGNLARFGGTPFIPAPELAY